MRHVVSNNEVPHLWANQVQSEARNANGSLFFENKTIYSYGRHFPIASFVTNSRGETAVLLTTRNYSMTTSHHVGCVRNAIRRDAIVFHVPLQGNWSPAEFIAAYQEQIKDESEKVARSRVKHTREYRFSHLVALVNEANRYAEFSDHSARFTVPTDFDALKVELTRIAAEQRAADKQRLARIASDNAERVAQWIAGDSVTLPWNLPETYLRIEGDEIVTSKGARVPVAHAITGLALVRHIKRTGAEYVRNGHTVHLGHYAIDRIDPDGNLTAGCHHITFAEIERIAPQLGCATVAGDRRAI